MSAARWDLTVIDSPGSEPWIIAGDVVIAVRTPRSRDFVTVEVAPAALCGRALERPSGIFLSPAPAPRLTHEWCGEVHVGDTVGFRFGDLSYRLTLARLMDSPAGAPWITCDFRLERD